MPYCRGFVRIFSHSGPDNGAIPRVFRTPTSHPRPSQGDAVNKAELTAALAMRTKMSKADAGRAIEALFDDKGIIAAELKKGAKRSEEHTSELQSPCNLVCRLLLEKKKKDKLR